ncbi:helix-turn-helix domain-containing protein [Leptotrichia hongkongensis]|uniref:helix-turn-helix domain-containing protein n=1 Tax=Leptotrichia hongkongensis TaxID=554406 RepID=UPI0035A8432A
MKLNEKLKNLRIENKMTQRELANKLGISIPTLQKYEYGTLNIKNEIILSLCDIFNISVDDFLNEKRQNEMDILKEMDDLEKEEFRRNKALLVIEKVKKKLEEKKKIQRERELKQQNYRKSEIRDNMETFKDQYYFEESLSIRELKFKNLFPIIEFLMSYTNSDIRVTNNEEVQIYNDTLKIKYETGLEDFEKLLTFVTDNFVSDFFSLLNYDFYNEYEEEKEEYYEEYEEDEDEE